MEIGGSGSGGLGFGLGVNSKRGSLSYPNHWAKKHQFTSSWTKNDMEWYGMIWNDKIDKNDNQLLIGVLISIYN